MVCKQNPRRANRPRVHSSQSQRQVTEDELPEIYNIQIAYQEANMPTELNSRSSSLSQETKEKYSNINAACNFQVRNYLVLGLYLNEIFFLIC